MFEDRDISIPLLSTPVLRTAVGRKSGCSEPIPLLEARESTNRPPHHAHHNEFEVVQLKVRLFGSLSLLAGDG